MSSLSKDQTPKNSLVRNFLLFVGCLILVMFGSVTVAERKDTYELKICLQNEHCHRKFSAVGCSSNLCSLYAAYTL